MEFILSAIEIFANQFRNIKHKFARTITTVSTPVNRKEIEGTSDEEFVDVNYSLHSPIFIDKANYTGYDTPSNFTSEDENIDIDSSASTYFPWSLGDEQSEQIKSCLDHNKDDPKKQVVDANDKLLKKNVLLSSPSLLDLRLEESVCSSETDWHLREDSSEEEKLDGERDVESKYNKVAEWGPDKDAKLRAGCFVCLEKLSEEDLRGVSVVRGSSESGEERVAFPYLRRTRRYERNKQKVINGLARRKKSPQRTAIRRTLRPSRPKRGFFKNLLSGSDDLHHCLRRVGR